MCIACSASLLDNARLCDVYFNLLEVMVVAYAATKDLLRWECLLYRYVL